MTGNRDELDPGARHLLGLAREARMPSASDRARMDALLGAALTLGSPGTAHATAAVTQKASTALALKWAAGLALLSVASGAGYLGHGALHGQDAPAPAGVTTSTVVVTPSAPERRPAAMSPSAPVAVPEPDEAVPRPATASRRTDRSLEAAHVTLPEELDLLHAVQSKWRKGDASSALALLAEHRQKYPKSQLAPERDALSVLCLCAVGRTAEARKIAHRFSKYAAHSPLSTSVEESCGGR